MAGLWLVACVASDYGMVTREIRGREEGALVLRFPTVEALEEVDHAVVGAEAGAAFCVRECPIEVLERAVASLAARVGRVVVFTDTLDAGYIARLFQAGAAEVIALGEACAGAASRREMGRAEVGCRGAGAPFPGDVVENSRVVGLPGPDDTGEIPPWDVPQAGCADIAGEGPLAGWVDAPSQAAVAGAAAEVPGDLMRVANEAAARVASSAACGPRAPVIAVVAGRGGVGKSTLVAAMACAAARRGLRAAMLDFDLMTGNLHELFGVEQTCDLGRLALYDRGALADADIEATALRIGPGLTLWGPLAAPERAELMGTVCERLIEVLRGVADVVLVDTSAFWGDAVGAAVATCDRCLLVGNATDPHAVSASRVLDLAARLGVPKTKMACVTMRCGAGSAEEGALRFEMGVGLRAKVRIADAGADARAMLSFGKMRDLMEGQGAFATDVSDMTGRMLRELGCPLAWDPDVERAHDQAKPRLRLPWKQDRGDAR